MMAVRFSIFIALLTIAYAFALPAHADELDIWLDKLAKAECGAPKCHDNFRIVDVNGRYSYGCYQFQEGTFIEQAKLYGLLPKYPNADPLELAAIEEEADKMIYDCDVQRQLARLMNENDKTAWARWQNTVLGMYVQGVFRPGIGCPPIATTCKG